MGADLDGRSQASFDVSTFHSRSVQAIQGFLGGLTTAGFWNGQQRADERGRSHFQHADHGDRLENLEDRQPKHPHHRRIAENLHSSKQPDAADGAVPGFPFPAFAPMPERQPADASSI
jgi:hypothetical protein